MDAVPDEHSAKPMTDEQDDENERTVEVTADKYQRLTNARSQVIGEGWMDVVRIDDETVRARPVDRQEGRMEGERITSDVWMIEDVNGEVYAVSEKTFEDKYDSLVTERFAIDLSFDDVPVEGEDGEDLPDMKGRDVVVEVTAHIDLRRDVITRLTIGRCVTDLSEGEGLPMEIFEDHPDINRITEDEDQDNE